MRRKQSTDERLNRLNQGCCPIHGSFMSQVDGWYYPEDREPYTIVGCSRRDCDARAMVDSYDGPWEIMPECAYLLDERYIPPPPNRRKKSDQPKAKKADVWAKTEGRCYYCGLVLEHKTTFCIDHIIPQIAGSGDGIDNVVPACRSCNSTKGIKTIEEFRFHRRMQKFQERVGVWFTFTQVEYLKSIGVELDIPTHVFWFEQQDDIPT
jgi:hypothetical protein